jgi:hypothetical protein
MNGNFEAGHLSADISAVFPNQNLVENPDAQTITHLAVHPAQKNWAVVAVTHKETQQNHLLLFNIRSGQLNLLFYQSNLQFSSPFHITDDGRYLTVPAFESGTLSGGWQLLVFDLEQVGGNWQFHTGTAYFDWSADGDWLLIAEENALRLISPSHNQDRPIPHTLACHTVGWGE